MGECEVARILVDAQQRLPALEAALASADPSRITVAANAVLYVVMPAYAGFHGSSDQSDALAHALLGAVTDLAEVTANIELPAFSSPGSSLGMRSAAGNSQALASLAHASREIDDAIRLRDQLVSSGKLRCH
jgi:hypothetical protein